MAIVYMKWKKYNEIQLIKNKMDLNNGKKLKINVPLPKDMLHNRKIHSMYIEQGCTGWLPGSYGFSIVARFLLQPNRKKRVGWAK